MKYGTLAQGHNPGACKECSWQRPLAWLLLRVPGRM